MIVDPRPDLADRTYKILFLFFIYSFLVDSSAAGRGHEKQPNQRGLPTFLLLSEGVSEGVKSAFDSCV
jgi:hypothetical protein